MHTLFCRLLMLVLMWFNQAGGNPFFGFEFAALPVIRLLIPVYSGEGI